jgi:RNA polymerase sigma-70 factor, ECF subfamily
MTFHRGDPLSPEMEQRLVLQMVAGDEEAVRTLYARFGRPIYTLGMRLLGSREAAEELTQDVFLTAWRKGSRYDPTRGRLSTWLMTIAHNMAVDRLRHDRGSGRPVVFVLEEMIEPPPADEEEALIDRETARRSLAMLGVAERELLSRTYFLGWTAREIAEADGIPLGTVKTRLRTALIRLRKMEAEHARAVARTADGEVE